MIPGVTKFDKSGGESKPTIIAMQDSAGATYYLWFDTSGVLHTTTEALGDAAAYDWNTSGDAVGGQS